MADSILKPRPEIEYVPYKESSADEMPRCTLDFNIHLPSGDIGAELLRLESFQAQEAISQIFEYQLILRANDHDPDDISAKTYMLDFSQLMGQAATIHLGLPQINPQKYVYTPFNGIITNIAMQESGAYTATLRSALWRLTLSNHYRVIPERNIRDTITYVLDGYNIDYDTTGISGRGNPALERIQDWLQAGESDYDFIVRLMQKAHLYFYFVHATGRHWLMLANRPLYQNLVPEDKPVRYTFSEQDSLGEDNLIIFSAYQQNMTSPGVRSIIARPDAAWEEVTTAALHNYISDPQNLAGQGFHDYYIFQYGGSQEEADSYTTTDKKKLDYSAYRFSGSSRTLILKPGYKFKLIRAGDSRPDIRSMRPMLDQREFVAISVQHQASATGEYENSFESGNADALVVDFAIQETHQGSILATVVSHGNAQYPRYVHYLDTDNFSWGDKKQVAKIGDQIVLFSKGVYVKFSTDSPGGEAVWIRLADHMQTVPEIGVTVLVSRSNDNSELPEIQSIVQAKGGRVINPDFAIANTNVGDNYSTSFGDSYSIRFGRRSKADLDAAVARVESEKKTGKFRDVSFSQGASYSYSISESGKSGLLSESESYGSTYNKQYSAITDNYSEVDNATSTSVIGSTVDNSTVGSSTRVSTTGVSSSTSTTGADATISGVGLATHASAVGMTTDASATGLSLGMSVTGVTTQLAMTGIESRVSMTGITTTASVIGISTQETSTGIETHVGSTGVSTSATMTGISSSISMLGMGTDLSTTGMRTSLSTTGLSTQISSTGVSTSIDSSGLSTSISSAGTRISINSTGTSVNVNSVGTSVDVSLTGSGVRLTNEAATVKVENIGPEVNMVAIKVVL